MHTSNLCSPALGQLGEVLSSVPAGAFDRLDFDFTQGETLIRYSADQPVILDYQDGMSSLILYTGESPQIYYLDRVVLLQPGVLFSIAPISKESHVCFLIPKNGALQEIDQVSSAFVNQTSQALEFEQLYTFFYQKSPGNFYFRGESHNPYELVYVDQGALHNLVDGRDIVLKQQECLIIGRNSWHIQFSDEPVSFLTVSFDLRSPFLDTLTGQAMLLRQDLKPLLEKMVHELQRDSFSGDCIEALLKLLLVELIRRPQQSSAARKPSTFHSENEILNQILQQISKNISSKISLQKLAESVHISVPYVHTLFVRHLGIPPGQYIMKIRMEESKLLLQEGTMTIGEVAARMGFSSIQHFSKQFKNICGISPSQYVKSLR